jgi:2-keto-3-deoxy-L-rhamnonate aldolase RhmA
MSQGFRQSVRDGAVLLGTFIKTASHQIPEVLGRGGLDFAIIDAEHAPFSLSDLDRMVVGARAGGLTCLVRMPDHAAAPIGQVLDLGADGVLMPHVKTAQSAQQVLTAAKYSFGARGFAPSTRAGGYGAPDAAAYRRAADAASSVWCQIEDAEALTNLDAIAAVEDVDCLFLGRADLSLSLGVDSQRDPKVVAAVRATAEAGKRHGRTVGIFIGDLAEIPDLLAIGITVFVYSSDHGFMLAESRRSRAALDAAVGRG